MLVQFGSHVHPGSNRCGQIEGSPGPPPAGGVESGCPELHAQLLEVGGMDAGGQVKTPGVLFR